MPIKYGKYVYKGYFDNVDFKCGKSITGDPFKLKISIKLHYKICDVCKKYMDNSKSINIDNTFYDPITCKKIVTPIKSKMSKKIYDKLR